MSEWPHPCVIHKIIYTDIRPESVKMALIQRCFLSVSYFVCLFVFCIALRHLYVVAGVSTAGL